MEISWYFTRGNLFYFLSSIKALCSIQHNTFQLIFFFLLKYLYVIRSHRFHTISVSIKHNFNSWWVINNFLKFSLKWKSQFRGVCLYSVIWANECVSLCLIQCNTDNRKTHFKSRAKIEHNIKFIYFSSVALYTVRYAYGTYILLNCWMLY